MKVASRPLVLWKQPKKGHAERCGRAGLRPQPSCPHGGGVPLSEHTGSAREVSHRAQRAAGLLADLHSCGSYAGCSCGAPCVRTAWGAAAQLQARVTSCHGWACLTAGPGADSLITQLWLS